MKLSCFPFRKLCLGAFFIFAGWGVLAAPAVSGEATRKIRIVGSTTVLPIAARAAEKFTALKKGMVAVTVNAGGSGVGIQSAGTGQVDIGMASREITAKEKKQFEARGLRTWAVGRDGVACAVSSEIYDAGVRTLSRAQIRDIYLGTITQLETARRSRPPHRGDR